MSPTSFNEWLDLRENKSNKARVFLFARKREIPSSIVDEILKDLDSPPTYSNEPRKKVPSKIDTIWKKNKDIKSYERRVGPRLSGEEGAEVYNTDYVGGKRDISPEVADKAIEMLAARKDPISPDIIARRDTKKQMIQQEKEQKMERDKKNNDYAKSARGIEDRKASQERQDKEYLDYLKNHGTKEDIKEYLKQMRDRDK